jgi:hypothetical protein
MIAQVLDGMVKIPRRQKISIAQQLAGGRSFQDVRRVPLVRNEFFHFRLDVVRLHFLEPYPQTRKVRARHLLGSKPKLFDCGL